jgi:hypothetical protein
MLHMGKQKTRGRRRRQAAWLPAGTQTWVSDNVLGGRARSWWVDLPQLPEHSKLR